MKRLIILFMVFGFLSCSTNTFAQVKAHQKISETEGGFTGALRNLGYFGRSVAPLGDLDGDGVPDLLVGTLRQETLWLLFLKPDGTVKRHQSILDTEEQSLDFFGLSVTNLGDLNGDGALDLAVGAPWDSDDGYHRGAVWVLFLNTDGTVKNRQKISDTEGGFTGILDDEDQLGMSVAPLGDLDGDGILELAVGATGDDDGGFGFGAMWILFLNADGTVKRHQKISQTEGGFTDTLVHLNQFGAAAAALGDLDGDEVPDLVVGAVKQRALWVLFLNTDGTVRRHQTIRVPGGLFGLTVANLGDLDGDGVIDLAAGAQFDSDGGQARGAIWLLFLRPDGTVKHQLKISDTAGGFTGALDDQDEFGSSVAALGDLDGDCALDLAVGATEDDDGGRGRGAVWILFLQALVTALDDPATADEGGSVDIDVLANDRILQGCAMSVSTVSDPAYGTVEIIDNGHAVRYTHDESETLIDRFTYTVRETNGSTGQATVTVAIIPVNDAPQFVVSPVITTPGDGAQIIIGGGEGEDPLPPETPFAVEWNGAVDPEGDVLSYRWQLATAEDFSVSNFLLDVEVGAQTRAEIHFGEVTSLLADQGLDLFGGMTLFHRVQASDGMLIATSDTASLTLVRGTLVNTEEAVSLPEHFMLAQNYPNPFNPTTRIRYALPDHASVRLTIYDVMGRLIEVLVEGEQPAGWHEATFEASRLTSGVYFYRLEAGTFHQVRQMLLLQ